MRKDGCSNPGRDKPKSLKQVMPVPMPNARLWMSWLLADDLIHVCPVWQKFGILKNPHCEMVIKAEHRSKYITLYWHSGCLHMSKNSWEGQKQQINKTKSTHKQIDQCWAWARKVIHHYIYLLDDVSNILAEIKYQPNHSMQFHIVFHNYGFLYRGVRLTMFSMH